LSKGHRPPSSIFKATFACGQNVESACKQNTFDDGKCPLSSPGRGSDPESLTKKTPGWRRGPPGFHANRRLHCCHCLRDSYPTRATHSNGARDASQHQRRCKQKTQPPISLFGSREDKGVEFADFRSIDRRSLLRDKRHSSVEPRPSCSSFHHARCDVRGTASAWP
jgi:hypothetical protein